MRLALVLLMACLCTGLATAAPGGQDEKPWSYPDHWFGDRETVAETEPNDTCTIAQPIDCGDIVNPGEITQGDQDWYSFTANAGDILTLGTDAIPDLPTVDTVIELFADDCSTSLAFDDDGGPGLYSLISGFAAPYTGTYNLLVRGFSTSSAGYYQLFTRCEPVQEELCDTCEDADLNGCAIDRCSTGTLEGSTSFATNDYSPESSCTGFSVNGLDVVYILDLEAGDTCDFIYTSFDCDGSFYIISDCGDPTGSCQAGADDTLGGEAEQILGWVAPATGRYYLVLDNWTSGCGGAWVLDYSILCGAPDEACCFEDGSCRMLPREECVNQGGTPQGPDTVCDPNPCEPVPTEESTWGQIKSDYR